jgi:flagellar motor switch protein FliN/FliY
MNKPLPPTAPTPRSSSPARAEPASRAADAGLSMDAAILRDVRVALRVKLGEVSLTVEELLALKTGSVVTLDRLMSDLVELHLNGALVARGEIVAVDDHFGVRIHDIAPTA